MVLDVTVNPEIRSAALRFRCVVAVLYILIGQDGRDKLTVYFEDEVGSWDLNSFKISKLVLQFSGPQIRLYDDQIWCDKMETIFVSFPASEP